MNTSTVQGDLACWQLLDWRFLLPGADLGRVAVGKSVPLRLRAALVESGHHVGELADSEATRLDTVVLSDSSHQEIQDARARLRPGGGLYLQVRRRPLGAERRALECKWSAWSALLHDCGFEAVSAYWSWPGLDRQLSVAPISSAPAARTVLERRGWTLRGRIKVRLVRLAWTLGAGPLTAREGFIVARRPEQPR